MAKLNHLTQANFVRIFLSLPLFLAMSGCDLDSDRVYYKSNDNVHHYAQLTKQFYINNGFDERSARAMAVLYNALFKTRYDKQIADHSNMVDGFDDVTFREAKNVFACSIFDGRALHAVNHKAEIKQQVDKFMSLVKEYEVVATPIINNGGTNADARAAFEEKYGPVAEMITIDRFFIITGFDKTFEDCAYKNIKQNYLSRPEAVQIE